MKKLFTIALILFTTIAFGQTKVDTLSPPLRMTGSTHGHSGWVQTKNDSALKAWSGLTTDTGNGTQTILGNITATGTMRSNIIQRRSDTVACYFLKAPTTVESSEPLPVQWFLGWYVNDNTTFKLTYLYLDKQPVKEQVLISIPKNK